MSRPPLDASLTGAELRRWYWLKAELAAFARTLGVSPGGGKQELTERLAAHLDGREPPAARPRRTAPAGRQLEGPLDRDTVIPAGQRSSQALRGFLLREIGPGFRFDAGMRAFVAAGAGRTLGELVDHWHATRDAPPPAIGAQFELNRFLREWHAAHPGGGREAAMAAWREHRDRPSDGRVLLGDNLPLMRGLEDGIATLIYADPPFNTGAKQVRRAVETTADEDGDRTGFGGRRYATLEVGRIEYEDAFDDDYVGGFLLPRLVEMHRLLADDGTLYLHLDYREAHYAKVALDGLFGRACFLNEIIWAYDYGGKPRTRWPAKHDTILVYVKDPARYHFDAEAVDREPYMAPGLVTPEQRERGKRPTDVHWHTIVSPTGREKTGYPTQKPEGLVRRFVQASTRPGDLCLDPFAGSGTLGAVAAGLGRRYLLIDERPEAVAVMRERLSPPI